MLEQNPLPKKGPTEPLAGRPPPAQSRTPVSIKLVFKVLSIGRFLCILLLIAILGMILQFVNCMYAFSLSKSFEHLPIPDLLVGQERT
jgi:hypothetical protein